MLMLTIDRFSLDMILPIYPTRKQKQRPCKISPTDIETLEFQYIRFLMSQDIIFNKIANFEEYRVGWI